MDKETNRLRAAAYRKAHPAKWLAYRHKNRDKYNDYMAEYMRGYRARKKGLAQSASDVGPQGTELPIVPSLPPSDLHAHPGCGGAFV